MRKEVKLGMALGGGLIAVLVAYLLIAPPTNNKKGAQFVDNSGAPGDVQQPADPAGTGAPAADGQLPQVGAPVNDTPAPADTPKPTGTRTGDVWTAQLDKGRKPAGTKTDAPAAAAPKDDTASRVVARTGAADAKPAPVEHKAAPAARPTETASANVAHTNDAPKLFFNPNAAWGDGLSSDGLAAAGRAARQVAGAPASRPSSASKDVTPTAANTRVVKSGDTFSGIALEAYGSSAYYAHLLRANPNVNPNNLKLGTVINVPPLAEVKAAADAAATHSGVAASVTQDVKIDSARQYKVQPGDSLYKIAVKLYGKGTYADKLYEHNKSAIGADPKKLKLGMILNLPEPATVNATVAAPAADRPAILTDGTASGLADDVQPK